MTTETTSDDAIMDWATICMTWGRATLAALPPHTADSWAVDVPCSYLSVLAAMQRAEGFYDLATSWPETRAHFARLAIDAVTHALGDARYYPACDTALPASWRTQMDAA